MKPLDIDLPPTLPMSFGTENSTVISAQSGSTALLPCVVHNLGDGMVRFKSRNILQKVFQKALPGVRVLRDFCSQERRKVIIISTLELNGVAFGRIEGNEG